MRVLCAVAAWRSIEVPTVNSLLRLQLAAMQHGNLLLGVRMLPGDALIARARSRLAQHFLASKNDVLLFVDSDIDFEPQDAIGLCEKTLRNDVVGAMYLTRSQPAQPALPLPPDVPVAFSPTSGLVAVPWLVTGFLAVHRRVLERLVKGMTLCDTDGPEPFYGELFQPEVGEIDGIDVWLSEDFAFCKRARDAGFGVWLDPSVRLGHWGSARYALEDRPLTLTRRVGGALEVA